MRRIVHGLQELSVSRRSSDVFGRTGMCTVQTPGRVQGAIELGHLHQRHTMPPAIAVVIDVFKPASRTKRLIQAYPLLAFHVWVRELGIQLTVVFTIDDELVQMPALPSHGP